MRMALALVIAAVLTAIGVWLMIEHQRTDDQIERLQKDLEQLKRKTENSSAGQPPALHRSAVESADPAKAWL